MMLEHLRRKGADAPKVVEFNPWQWAAQDKLAEAFFREISLALGKKEQTNEAKKRAATFSAYAAYLKLGTHLITGIRPLLSTVLALTGIMGISVGYVQQASRLKANLRLVPLKPSNKRWIDVAAENRMEGRGSTGTPNRTPGVAPFRSQGASYCRLFNGAQ